MMLTPYDIQVIEKNVEETISQWNTFITILIPLPEEQQTNWNPIMREYSGDVIYDTINNVPAELKYILFNIHESHKTDIAGDHQYGDISYSIPNKYELTPNCMFIIDNSGDLYETKSIRNRIGERIVQMRKMVGGIPGGISSTLNGV